MAIKSTTTEGKVQGERKKHTPPEELYDLTKPIPKEPKPDQAAFDTQIEEITSSLDALKDLKNALKPNLEATLKTTRSSESEEMKELRNQKANLINQKKTLQTTLAQTKETIDGLMNDREAAKSSVKYTSVDQIEKEIAKLKNKQETVSMNVEEEKALIEELDALQKNKDLVVSHKQTSNDSKLQRKDVAAQLKAKKEEINVITAKIAEKQKVWDEMKPHLDEMKKEMEVLRTQIGEKSNERKEVREAFNAQKDKWSDYQRAIKAQEKLKQEEEKKARE